MIKLSVVIPVYNGEDFIEKSYNSILNQNIDSFEIIYVNNNSKDNSKAKILEVVKKDDRVHYYEQTKQGAAPARNLGISKVKGTYVYIFDVDDEIYPNALNKMIRVLDNHDDIDAVFGKMVKSTKGIDETVKPSDETDELILHEKPYWGLLWFKDLKTVVGPPAFLYRKSVFSKIGVYNEELRICEDTAFDINLGMTSNVAFIDTYVYLYFKHNQSIFELSKKEENQIYILWSRLVKSHLPFYFENDTNNEYNYTLFQQLYSTMAKVIVYSNKGIKQRKALYLEAIHETKPLKIPLAIKIYLKLFVLFPNKNLLKFYVYYFLKLFLPEKPKM